MKEEIRKVITKDGVSIKLPYPNPISDHQRSKNIGYVMGWRAAKKSIESIDEVKIKEMADLIYKHFKYGSGSYDLNAMAAAEAIASLVKELE